VRADLPLIELATVQDGSRAGGKAATLAELARAGLPVPPAWVLPAGVLGEHLAQCRLADHARRVEDELAAGQWTETARQLRSTILGAPLPNDVARAVASLLAESSVAPAGPTFAVRSSATCEGLPGASFAGQFQTFLDVRTVDEASAAIRSCWASLWSNAALAYRASQALGRPPGMAVLLQVFVPGRAAGAARVDADGVVVEAGWGLGASVMSGLVVPDRFLFGPGAEPRSVEPGHKPVRAKASGGNLVWQAVPAASRQAPCLGQRAARLVARLALRAAAILGTPLEVEWVLAESGDRRRKTVWLVQARPSEPRCDSALDGSTPDAARNGAGMALRGIPIAPGVVVGPVRLIDRLEELEDVAPGEVAVARFVAGMGIRFRGAGLVTEMGGSSAHVAAIARERRLPMIVGVLRATRLLREGQLVRVDGAAGLVEVVDRNRAESVDQALHTE